MSEESPTRNHSAVDRSTETDEPTITPAVVLTAMGGGLVGTVLMLPILVGIPAALDLFVTDPIVRFAGIAAFFGYEPTLALGVALFGVGGVVVLPLTFVVVGGFLPPESPRYLRGASFATLYWVGFVPAFWPDGSVLVVAAYLVFSLVAHWVYGLSLGVILERLQTIPQHQV